LAGITKVVQKMDANGIGQAVCFIGLGLGQMSQYGNGCNDDGKAQGLAFSKTHSGYWHGGVILIFRVCHPVPTASFSAN
jgi:hypothetical protein